MENKSETEAAVELKINDAIGALSLVVGGASSGKDGESPIQIIYGINEKIKDAGSSADFGGIDDEYGDGGGESFRDKLRRFREGSMTAEEEFEFEDSSEYREWQEKSQGALSGGLQFDEGTTYDEGSGSYIDSNEALPELTEISGEQNDDATDDILFNEELLQNLSRSLNPKIIRNAEDIFSLKNDLNKALDEIKRLSSIWGEVHERVMNSALQGGSAPYKDLVISSIVSNGFAKAAEQGLVYVIENISKIEADEISRDIFGKLLRLKNISELIKDVDSEDLDLSTLFSREDTEESVATPGEGSESTKIFETEDVIDESGMSAKDRVEAFLNVISPSLRLKAERLLPALEKEFDESGRLFGEERVDKPFRSRNYFRKARVSGGKADEVKSFSLYNSLSAGARFFSYSEDSLFYKKLDEHNAESDDPLSFSLSVFSEATDLQKRGYQIIVSENDEEIVDVKTDDLSSLIRASVNRINEYQSFVTSIMSVGSIRDLGDQNKYAIQKTNKYRRSLAVMIDDFISSLIYRDNIIAKDERIGKSPILKSRVMSIPLLMASNSFDSLCSTIATLVRPSLFYGWTAYSSLPEGKSIDDYKRDLEDAAIDLVRKKVSQFLRSPGKNFSKSLVDYVDSNISVAIIRSRVIGSKSISLKRKITACHLCGKKITLKFEWAGKAGELATSGQKKQYEDKKLYYKPYSLTRTSENGVKSLISLNELNSIGNFSLMDSDEKAILLLYGGRDRLNEDSLVPKTWSQINEDYLSGNPLRVQEAILRKSFALRDMGADQAGPAINLTTTRLKCPFSGEFQQKFKIKDKGEVLDEPCGLTLLPDVSAINRQTPVESINPSIFSARQMGDADAEEYVKQSLLDGSITSSQARQISKMIESSKSRGGGWKFSQRSFLCPTIIPSSSFVRLEEEDDEQYEERLKAIFSKHNRVVTPLSGPLKEDSFGAKAGSLTYLMCGALTSVSQFDKKKLKMLIDSFLTSAESDESFVADTISSLITLGVDQQDIAELITLSKNPLRAKKAIRSDRLKKISALLSLAMAAGRGQVYLGDDLFEAISNLTLTCRHGHSFTVKDAIDFSASHKDCLRIPSHKKGLIGNVIKYNLLGSSGDDNRRASLDFESDNRRLFEKNPATPDRTEGFDATNQLPSPYTIPFNEVYWTDEGYEYRTTERSKQINLSGGSAAGGSRQTASVSATAGGSVLVKTLDEQYLSQSFDAPVGGEDSKSFSETVGQESEVEKFQAAKTRAVELSKESADYIRMYLYTVKDFLASSVSTNYKGRMAVDPKKRLSFSKSLENNQAFVETLKSLIQEVVPNGNASIIDATSDRFMKIIKSLDETQSLFYLNLNEGIQGALWKWIVSSVIYSTKDLDETRKSRLRRNLVKENEFDQTFVIMNYAKYSEKLAELANALDYEGKKADKILDQTDNKAIVQMQESEYIRSITMAACAFGLSHKLSEIYDNYFNESSPGYIGISLPNNLDFSRKNGGPSGSTNYGAVSIDFSDIGIYSENLILSEKQIDNSIAVDLQGRMQDLVDDLKLMYHHVIYMCRSSHWRGLGLEYIRDTLGARISDGDESNRAKAVLDRVFSNPGGTTISLHPDSKYARNFSMRGDLIPLASRFFVQDISYSKGSSTKGFIDIQGRLSGRPIYRLTRNFVFGLSIQNEVDVILSKTSLSESDLYDTGSVFLMKKEELERARGIIEGGYNAEIMDLTEFILERFPDCNMFFANVSEKDLKLQGAERPMSMLDHPATTKLFGEDDSPYYENLELGFSTNLFSIGEYGKLAGPNQCYPYGLSNFTNSVGVTIPIVGMSKPSPKGEDRLAPSAARIFVDLKVSADDEDRTIAINLSDFLQRESPEAAWQYLSKIRSIWKSYKLYERKSGGSLGDAKKSEVKRRIQSLFAQYRALPLFVKKSDTARTKTSERGREGAMGWYIPLINPIIMNMFIEEECFHPSWGGHTGWGLDIGDDIMEEVKQSMKEFCVKVNGLDKLAEIINGKKKLFVEGKAPLDSSQNITGLDLLSPKDMFSESGRLNPQSFGLNVQNIDKDDGDYVSTAGSQIADKQIGSGKTSGSIGSSLNYILRPFHPISGLKPSGESLDGASFLTMPTTGFRKKKTSKIPNYEEVNQLYEGDLLSEEHLSGVEIKMIYELYFSGRKPFAQLFRKWFENRIKRISEGIINRQERELEKDEDLFGSEASHKDDITKFSSKIINQDIIKKSEKYKTNIFSETIVLDEELLALIESAR